VVYALLRAEIAADGLEDIRWEDGDAITDAEIREVICLSAYEVTLRRRRRNPAQRKSMRLLWRHLSAEQRRQVRGSRYFYLTTESGATYRLYPCTGATHAVEKHGKNYFAMRGFCLHPDDNPLDRLPPADLSLAHLLLLSCDEPAFLAEANCRLLNTDMWNGEYLRRMRRRRREAQPYIEGDLMEMAQRGGVE
jgi:hypothetical protein